MANTPTFDGLMAEGATPRRTPILNHAAITKSVIEWFQNKSKWRAAEAEMQLPTKDIFTSPRRADVVAPNTTDHESYIIEVKAQWNDFVRDRKFFDYRKWCHWFAFAVPEELASCACRRMDDIDGWYEGVGLLVIPNDFGNRRMTRRPSKYEMDQETYRKMIERRGMSCWGRLIDARGKSAGLEFEVNNLRSNLR